jgi:hypothetical protein
MLCINRERPTKERWEGGGQDRAYQFDPLFGSFTGHANRRHTQGGNQAPRGTSHFISQVKAAQNPSQGMGSRAYDQVPEGPGQAEQQLSSNEG